MPSSTALRTIGEMQEVNQTFTSLPRTDESTPLEHKIAKREGYITSPLMFHRTVFQVKKWVDGKLEKIPAKDRICLANLPAMTMYKTIEMYLNGYKVTSNDGNHGIVTQLRALTEYSPDQKEMLLRLAGWFPDEGKEIYNEQRGELTRRNKIELLCPVMIDCLNHSQPFPDNVEIMFKFYRAPKQFVLNGVMVPEGDQYEINVLSSELLITRQQLEPGTNLFRQLHGMLYYHFISHEPRHFIIPSKITSINEDIYQGVLPYKTIILYLEQEAYNGKYTKNPFQFDDYLTKSINLKLNDKDSLPPTPYEFELAKSRQPEVVRKKRAPAPERLEPQVAAEATGSAVAGGASAKRKRVEPTDGDADGELDENHPDVALHLVNYARAYHLFMDALGNHSNTRLTYEQFTNGKFIQTWDLRKDRDPEPGTIIIQDKGSLKVQASFYRVLDEPIVMLVINQQPRYFTISERGEVKVY
jgi:hypothetical protein